MRYTVYILIHIISPAYLNIFEYSVDICHYAVNGFSCRPPRPLQKAQALALEDVVHAGDAIVKGIQAMCPLHRASPEDQGPAGSPIQREVVGGAARVEAGAVIHDGLSDRGCPFSVSMHFHGFFTSFFLDLHGVFRVFPIFSSVFNTF